MSLFLKVATALTNGDSELGNFIAKGMEKVGKDSFPMIAVSCY